MVAELDEAIELAADNGEHEGLRDRGWLTVADQTF